MTKNSKKKLYIRRTVSVLAVLAMLFSLSACVFPTAEEDLPEETASSAESVEEPASDAEVETSNGSYEISAQYNLDLNELEQWYTTENGNFVPNQWDIDNLKSIAKENPEYEEHINFFIEHIGSYNQTAVNNVSVAPEKVDFALIAPFAKETETGNWNFKFTEGEIPYFLQYDTRWAFHKYGNGFVGYTGCGPTCLAMAVAGLTDDYSATPDRVSDYAESSGYYVDGAGTDWRLFTDGAVGLGLGSMVIATDEAVMKQELDGGNVLVASCNPGDFTRVGHFIVIHSYSDEGFWIYDPSSMAHSSVPWTMESLSSQVAQVWSLWAA